MEIAIRESDPTRYGYSSNSPTFNRWVDAQRAYIMGLPLEVRGSIVEWDANSSLFGRHPEGYQAELLNIAMEGAPPIPMDIMAFKGLRNVSFLPKNIEDSIGKVYSYESFYATTLHRSYAGKFLAKKVRRKEEYIMNILVHAGTQCLYIQAYTDDVGELVLPRNCQIHVLDARTSKDGGVILECETMICDPSPKDIEPRDDAMLLSSMAMRETWEEIGIEARSWGIGLDPNIDPPPPGIQPGPYIDVPLWDQDPLPASDSNPWVPRYPIETSWGPAGAGLMIVCQDDSTFLALKRAPKQRSFPLYWSIPGGGVAEGYTSPVKAHYIFRTFIVYVTSAIKTDMNRNIELDPENVEWDWIPLNVAKPEDQGGRFASYAIPETMPSIIAAMSPKAIAWKGLALHPGLAYSVAHLQL